MFEVILATGKVIGVALFYIGVCVGGVALLMWVFTGIQNEIKRQAESSVCKEVGEYLYNRAQWFAENRAAMEAFRMYGEYLILHGKHPIMEHFYDTWKKKVGRGSGFEDSVERIIRENWSRNPISRSTEGRSNGEG